MKKINKRNPIIIFIAIVGIVFSIFGLMSCQHKEQRIIAVPITPTDTPTPVSDTPETTTCDIAVSPGDTIVTEARKTTCLHGGTYVQSVNISADNVTLTNYPGESPVIDGQNTLGDNYGYLLRLYGDNINVSGIEIKKSAGICVRSNGDYNTISNLNVHHCWNNGILISGDYTTAENNEVWQASQINLNGVYGYGSSGLSAGRYPNHAVIRHNLVYDNWGEGISSFEATNTLIEGNEIRDNWSVNLYISDSTGVIARDNEIYTTASSPVEQDPTGPKVGILMGDERCGPCSEDIQVLNNHVTGARCNLYIGYSYNPDGTNADLVITGNTFEESTYQAGVRVNSYASESWPGFVFENNTIIQTNGLPLISDAAGIIDESINTIVTGNAPPTMMPLQRTDHFHQH